MPIPLTSPGLHHVGARSVWMLRIIILYEVYISPFFFRRYEAALPSRPFCFPHIGKFTISGRIAIHPPLIKPINAKSCKMKMIPNKAFKKETIFEIIFIDSSKHEAVYSNFDFLTFLSASRLREFWPYSFFTCFRKMSNSENEI